MAMIHVGLLGLSTVILGCIIYLIAQQNLDAEVENILIIFSVAIVFLMLCVLLVRLWRLVDLSSIESILLPLLRKQLLKLVISPSEFPLIPNGTT